MINKYTVAKQCFYALVITTIITAPVLAQPVLTQVPSPTMQSLNAVSEVISGSDTLGVAVGDNIIIRGTSANNWSTVASPQGTLLTVHFPTITTGYAGGTGQTSGSTYLIKSTDGGMTWNAINYPDNFLTVRKLFFTDANTGYVVAQDTNVYKTSNGGTSWTNYTIRDVGAIQSQYQWVDVFFTDAMHGYALAAKTINPADIVPAISTTTDGGITWSAPVTISNTPYGLTALFFVNNNTGYVTGTVHANSRPINIFRTTNGGSTFVGLEDIINTTNTSLYFLNDSTGFIAGNNGTILYTSDSAKTFTNLSPGVSATFNSISFGKGSSTGYVVGDNGYIFKIDASNVSDNCICVTSVTATTTASPVTIYPNPCPGTFTISPKLDSFYQLNVLNALGQQIHKQSAAGTAIVSLPNMKAGIYYVQVESAQGNSVQKLLVQE